MDTKYEIEVVKGKDESLSLDGLSQKTNTIKLVNDKMTHRVYMTIK